MALNVLAEVVIDAFIQDVTDLVHKSVKAIKDEADLHPERFDMDWVKVRWDSLARWEHAKDRLDYGDGYDNFILLSRALAPTEDDPVHGIPFGNNPSISVGELARSIHNICRHAVVRQQIRAPVWRDGILPSVARMAIANAHNRMGRHISEEDKDAQLIKFLTTALVNRNVHFFPNSPTHGAPFPSTECWTSVGNRPTPADVASNNLETIGNRRLRLCEEQGRIVSQADVTAHWTIENLDIESFAHYIDRQCLPDEWEYVHERSITGNKDILPVYQWAESRLRIPTTDWRTRLALTLGFLMMKLTPDYVFCPDSTKVLEYPILETVLEQLSAIIPATRHHSITITRQLPWISKGRKGTAERDRYFTQATVTILAWVDSSSPLRNELARKQKSNPLIGAYNAKHSKFTSPP